MERTDLHGTFYDTPPPEHHCRLPMEAEQWPDGYAPKYWECGVCGQGYDIDYSQNRWTGWWSLSTEIDAVRGTDEYGHGYIKCAWQEWHDCPPSLTFKPRKPNNLGVSGIGFAHPNPSPRPDYMPPLPQPLIPAKQTWKSKTTPLLPERLDEALEPRRRGWVEKILGRS